MATVDPRESDAPFEPPVCEEHDCDDHSYYTCGAMGWGWYCGLCGSFAPMDEIMGE